MLLIYNNDLKRNCVLRKIKKSLLKKSQFTNILGQRLISVDKVTDLDTIEIPFNVQRGAYIVKVNTRGTIYKKILKQ
jgi:hypothetical protein